MKNVDVLVIGAGPSGSICSALMLKNGFKIHDSNKYSTVIVYNIQNNKHTKIYTLKF